MSKRLILGLMMTWAMTSFGTQWLAFIDNAGFERGELAWDSWGDSDIRTEYFGVSPSEGDNFLRLWTRSGWYQDFPVHSGDTYQLSAYVAMAKDDALWGDAFGEIKIEWRNKDNEDVETGKTQSIKFDFEGHQDKRIPKDAWVLVKLPIAVAPSKATDCRVLMTIYTESGDIGGGCALFDNIQINKR